MDVNQLFEQIIKYVHTTWNNPYFDGAIIIAIYAILSKVVDLIIDKVVKNLARLTNISMDDAIIAFIHRPLCYTIFLLGPLHLLAQMPPPHPWDFIASNTVKSLILLIWWISSIRTISEAIRKPRPRSADTGAISAELFYLFRNLVRIVLLVSGILAILMIWDISLTPLFASAGIAGIAVAMAAKDTLANFFGGISIFMDKTYKVGDYIIIDSGERGEVMDIGIRSTRIKTRDDILISIPNSIMANAKIINESAPVPRFRIRVPVGVSYDSDLPTVEKTLNRIALENKRVVKRPEPRSRVRKFAASSVDLELLCWVEDPRLKGLVSHELFKAIHETFAREGIKIPFPRRDIQILDDASYNVMTDMNNEEDHGMTGEKEQTPSPAP